MGPISTMEKRSRGEKICDIHLQESLYALEVLM